MKGNALMIRAFLMPGVFMAVLSPPVAARAADGCQDVTATNRQHARAGRAYYAAALGDAAAGYNALGSEDYP